MSRCSCFLCCEVVYLQVLIQLAFARVQVTGESKDEPPVRVLIGVNCYTSQSVKTNLIPLPSSTTTTTRDTEAHTMGAIFTLALALLTLQASTVAAQGATEVNQGQPGDAEVVVVGAPFLLQATLPQVQLSAAAAKWHWATTTTTTTTTQQQQQQQQQQQSLPFQGVAVAAVPIFAAAAQPIATFELELSMTSPLPGKLEESEGDTSHSHVAMQQPSGMSNTLRS